MEVEIRKLKDENIFAKTMNDEETYLKTRNQIKKLTKKYKNISRFRYYP